MPFTRRTLLAALAAAALPTCAFSPHTISTTPESEDGSRLWLRFPPLDPPRRPPIAALLIRGNSPTSNLIRSTLQNDLAALLAHPIPLEQTPVADALLIVTPDSSQFFRSLNLNGDLTPLGPEGFLLRRITWRPTPAAKPIALTLLAANTDLGALYGAYHLLRLLQDPAVDFHSLNVAERPRLALRLLNHWDNANGTIERGYAGRSLWQWDDLPDKLSPRYAAYARANASLGLNGTVLNNVNADIRFLTAPYLHKIAALADVFRPYGLRVYLAVNFAAPVTLGKLATADPLDPAVIDWWKQKADEIYTLIPDFGGFLVKANSEGQPGPQDYHRTHAQGANALAAALAPHNGHVIWRAFIYDQDVDPDRAKRAYIEFTALDGRFSPNVLLQIKNGPIDFQPREPFHPLFGALEQTPALAELQPTQEYLGQAKHLVYLGTQWKEFFDSDTFAHGPGSTVGKILDGTYAPAGHVTGIAGVLNTGEDANWCGHHFSQANWYAFGRLAWDHRLPAEKIADEWVRQTLTQNDGAVAAIRSMMMSSWETFVRYTMPLGLHHLIGGDHYAPMPWNATAQRPDWTAVYYHQAAADGIGFDRTRRGDRAVEQYFPEVRDTFDDVARCPEKFLLWFHHLPWDHPMKSGRTLWDELCATYARGAREAAALEQQWSILAPHIDPRRHGEVASRLAIQRAHAAQWCDQILRYFQQFSGR